MPVGAAGLRGGGDAGGVTTRGSGSGSEAAGTSRSNWEPAIAYLGGRRCQSRKAAPRAIAMAAAIHGHSGRPRNIANESVVLGSGTGALVAGAGIAMGAIV